MVLRISEKRKLKIRTLLSKLLASDPINFEGKNVLYISQRVPVLSA